MEEIWILFLAGLAGGFFDAQVGGGGAITLPVLLATGMPPHLALGTNKLVATGASTVASVQYMRAGLVEHRLAWPLWGVAGVASVAGVLVVRAVPAGNIRWMVILIMSAIAVYTVVRPALGRHEQLRPRTAGVWFFLVALAVTMGFYDGFLGPGTGSMLLFGFVAVAGFGFRRAAVHARMLNWASNLWGLAAWGLLGLVAWQAGVPMLAGTVLGGWLGSHLTVRAGDRWVRPLFLAVTVLLLVRLVWDML